MQAKKNNGLYYALACVNELRINRIFGLIETTSLGSGNDNEYVYSRKRNWKASLGGVCVLTDLVANAWTIQEIAGIPDTFNALDVRFILTDTGGAAVTWSGKVLLPDFGISASIQDGGEPAMWNCELQGTGLLNIGSVVVPTGGIFSIEFGAEFE